jgi:hypothetical protein
MPSPRTTETIMTKTKKPQSKLAIVTKLLSREKGASIAEMAKATNWKDHSVRAFLTGVRKKQPLTKEERGDGVSAYRLAAKGSPEPAATAAAENNGEEASE